MFGFHPIDLAVGALLAWNVVPQPNYVKNFWLWLVRSEKRVQTVVVAAVQSKLGA